MPRGRQAGSHLDLLRALSWTRAGKIVYSRWPRFPGHASPSVEVGYEEVEVLVGGYGGAREIRCRGERPFSAGE